MKRKVYCYETLESFNSIKEAAHSYGYKYSNYISKVLNKSHRVTPDGYHWCTDLSIFDGSKLTSGRGQNLTRLVSIYCYETKQKFDSIKEAEIAFNLLTSHSSLISSIDRADYTCGGYHWCTSLDVFDGVELIYPYVEVYCYETREKFNSIVDACTAKGIVSRSNIWEVIDKPNRTASGFHWCTSLDVFDGIDFTKLNKLKSKPESEIKKFLEDLGLEVIQGSRKLISPYEIDLYIPSKNFAIEYNGGFWHDEEEMLKYYGRKPTPKDLKSSLCKEQGITLLHIEESDFLANKLLVLNTLKDYLKIM